MKSNLKIEDAVVFVKYTFDDGQVVFLRKYPPMDDKRKYPLTCGEAYEKQNNEDEEMS